MHKFIKIINISFLLVFIYQINTYPQKNIEITKFLPSTPSFCLYLNSLHKIWNDFKYSYFWKKYKLSSQGKELQKSIDSISASFLIIGLTFDDLLEIFSGDSIIALWISNNYLTDFMYIIESNKKIEELLQRLEYFAIANKVYYNKYNYNNSEIINYNHKIFVAQAAKYIVIANNKPKLETTVNNIINNTNTIDLQLNISFDKETNIFLWNNYNKSVLYSFNFKNNLEIEALTEIRRFETNSEFNLTETKFIPSDVEFVAFSANSANAKEMFLPLFENIDTNVINVDIEHFNSILDKIRYFPDGYTGTAGINFTSKSTNLIFVFENTNIIVKSNFIKESTNSISYYGKQIYYLNSPNKLNYFLVYDEYLLFSNDLSFLKRAVESYKNRRSFYYSQEMQKIKSRCNFKKELYSFMWFDLKKYIISKSYKYPDEKWIYYNAYIKTFGRLLIYGYKKDSFFYSILKTYSHK